METGSGIKYKARSILTMCDRAQNAQDLLNSIYTVSKNNAITLNLEDNSLSTTDYFQKICYSADKPFLIIRKDLCLKRYKQLILLSLIVKYCPYCDFDYISSKMTITNLKRIPFQIINRDSLKKYHNTRYEQLVKCIYGLDLSNSVIGDYVPFKLPCNINAQTEPDRYRSDFDFDNKYGETPEFFMLLGARVESYLRAQ